ncbi:aldo/keto reductase [Sunxiuqinia rutila]|uniref:aldo/keto reductase n=1 Tax=Sunxiuqinia rutila TaxID=1397841 RepID=UPI003D359C0E
MDYSNLSLFRPQMEYRRFGKTNKHLSVITLGGMRFKHAHKLPRHEVPRDTLNQASQTVRMALEQGINLIETAYGYTKSETIFGRVLNQELKVKRDRYFLMTKGNPKTAEATRQLVEEQLKTLQTDYFDFYAWHGINTPELLEQACSPGGPVETLLQLKEEGVIGHVGFSTHAPLHVILKAIETDLFDFVNLHYYYFFQRNEPAIALAQKKDMGVFIISPNDKGGRLFSPPPKLQQLTAPLSPLQWNARFCLSNPGVHTLSFGLNEPEHFDPLNGIFPAPSPLSADDLRIKRLLDQQVAEVPYADFDGYAMENDPSGLNIPEILRFRKLWKCYDMKAFGEYRYNMFQEKDHWFPGQFPTEENLQQIDLSRCPEGIPIAELIRETHEGLYRPK